MTDELNQLSAEASALDSEVANAGNPPDPAIEQAAIVNAGNSAVLPMLKQLLGLLVLGGSHAYPFIVNHFTPTQVDEVALSIINLADEYGIELSKWMGEGGTKLQAWARLVLAVGIPTMGCIQAARILAAAPSPAEPVKNNSSAAPA